MILKFIEGGIAFLGTGFLCHQKGYLLTCAHILNLTDKLAVLPARPIDTFAERTLGRANPLYASVAQFDPVNDVALLKLTGDATCAVPEGALGSGERAEVGSSVGCLGFPFGNRGLHSLKITSTIICGKSSTDVGTKHLHLDSNIHEGNSGGPIVDVRTNRIIGIISGRFSPTGPASMIRINDYGLGQDSTISFGVPIEYGLTIMKSEGLDV